MLGLSRILVPVDFSTDSEVACDYAVDLARHVGCELRLLHVWNPLAWLPPPGALDLPPSSISAAHDAAAQALDRWRDKLKGQGVACVAQLEPGPPSPTIAQVAAEVGAELIVIGTRGRAGLRHVLLGSVAERTIRLAPCPVVTVPAETRSRPTSLRRVVASIDFSAPSRRALGVARELGELLSRPELLLVHAYEELTARGDILQDPAQRQQDGGLVKIAEQLRRAGWAVRCVQAPGDPEDVLPRVAREERADLIALGTRGRSRASAVLLGSVAERVVRTATCPTLTVR